MAAPGEPNSATEEDTVPESSRHALLERGKILLKSLAFILPKGWLGG